MRRRDFLRIAGAVGLHSYVFRDQAVLGDERKDVDLKKYFQWEAPAVGRLTEEVFRHRVFGMIKPPEKPLLRRWILAGGWYYGQWIWDTMFVVDLLSIFPGQEQLIRDVFQNYWDFQDRWNKSMPEYAHDMVSNAIMPKDPLPSGVHRYSQIPILAWGVERVYRRNGDKKLLEQCLDRLERFHEWYWRERDVTNVGMVSVGAYSGLERHARWETFDDECNMDDLDLTFHPTRKDKRDKPCYGNILVTGNTSYLVAGERSLCWLAEKMGNTEMVARRKKRIDKAVQAIRTHMWDDARGLFVSVHRDTLKQVPVGTIGSWIPLWAGIPTQEQADRMANTFKTPNWQTPLMVTTLDRTDPRWIPHQFWRGDTWPASSYQVAAGMAQYGHKDLAAEITDKWVANSIKNGLREFSNSMTGEALGQEYIGMSCTVVTMMLDKLTKDHILTLRTDPA